MEKAVGLWIDHREAVVVTVSGKTDETKLIPSNVEKRVEYSGGAKEVIAEDRLDRKYLDHLAKYYAGVIASIKGAESILIIGPGEAKREFAKQLQSEGLGKRIVGIETADRMTDRQIAAKVRQRFLEAS
ncbi:MAG TPA: hypothetical protein VGM51_12140 [Armatimonadota bacterium]|jgi:stalled ribosome rescue protein Dom34